MEAVLIATAPALFKVHVTHSERDGKHIAMTTETGIICVGDTQEQATERVKRWNAVAVEFVSEGGDEDLIRYFEARGIPYGLA